MNKYDIKYIFKRVFIFFIIFIIMSFINSCDVHASTYPIDPKNVTFNLWTTTGAYSPTGNTDTLYENNSATNYFGFTETIELNGFDSNQNFNVLFPGQYLIEFYIYSSNSTISSNPSCSNYRSNFTNVNMTTGNWVSNEIASQCVDVYNTKYNGLDAVRLLYKFTYKGATTGADGITQLRFNINSSPNDWFYSGTTGFKYGLSSSNIYDYDSNIVSEFENFKQNQTIIAQNGAIISGIDGIIQRQNQQHTDSLNTQNAINDLNDNINDDNVDGANSQVDDLLNNSAFNDNSGIQSIINAPLNFINGLSNSCSPINITIPYINSNLSIPCIKQELTNHVPTLVPILSTAINGFVIYRILIDIVYLVKSSRNPDDDRIEVLDL